MKNVVAVTLSVAVLLVTTLSSARAIPQIRGHLAAHAFTKVNLIVPGDTVTIVSVTGDGGDVDCTVAAADGRLIDKDISPADVCSFGIFPNTDAKSQPYTLVIEDASDKDENYILEVQ